MTIERILLTAALSLFASMANAASFTFSVIDVPGASDTVAYGINDLGDIVGTVGQYPSTSGFVFSGGHYSTFGTSITATGMNDSGQISGS